MLKTRSRSRIARLNSRQRKKHRVAEFQELGRAPIEETDGFIVAERGSVSAAQRDALLAWLRARPEVREAQASDWQDAWYGWED